MIDSGLTNSYLKYYISIVAYWQARIGEREIFSHFSLSISNGEMIALTGKNGCGKSSLLKIIAGQQHATSGEVRIASNLVLTIDLQEYTSKRMDGKKEICYNLSWKEFYQHV